MAPRDCVLDAVLDAVRDRVAERVVEVVRVIVRDTEGEPVIDLVLLGVDIAIE